MPLKKREKLETWNLKQLKLMIFSPPWDRRLSGGAWRVACSADATLAVGLRGAGHLHGNDIQVAGSQGCFELCLFVRRGNGPQSSISKWKKSDPAANFEKKVRDFFTNYAIEYCQVLCAFLIQKSSASCLLEWMQRMNKEFSKTTWKTHVALDWLLWNSIRFLNTRLLKMVLTEATIAGTFFLSDTRKAPGIERLTLDWTGTIPWTLIFFLRHSDCNFCMFLVRYVSWDPSVCKDLMKTVRHQKFPEISVKDQRTNGFCFCSKHFLWENLIHTVETNQNDVFFLN